MEVATSITAEDTSRQEMKREIVGYLVYLHLLIWQLFNYEQKHYPRHGANQDAQQQFYRLLSEVERDIEKELQQDTRRYNDEWLNIPVTQKEPGPVLGEFASAYTPVRKDCAMRRAKTLHDSELDTIIKSSKPNAFYDHFLAAQKRLFEVSKSVARSQHFKATTGRYLAPWSGPTVELKEISQFSLDAIDNMDQLVVVLNLLQSLRECIGKAAEASCLAKDELLALKLKLAAFDKDSGYWTATRLVSHAMEVDQRLVDSNRDKWW